MMASCLVASGFLLLSCLLLSGYSAQAFRENEKYTSEIKGILDGSYTKSPLGYLLPLEPVSTSIVIVAVLGVIALLSTLVYWPMPRKYQNAH